MLVAFGGHQHRLARTIGFEDARPKGFGQDRAVCGKHAFGTADHRNVVPIPVPLVDDPAGKLRARLRVADDDLRPHSAQNVERGEPRGRVLLHRIEEDLTPQRPVEANLQARRTGRDGGPVEERLSTRTIARPAIATQLDGLSPALALS